MSAPILTDDHGRPIERPCRENFAAWEEWMHALHAYNDRVHQLANVAFAEAFAKAMKRSRRAALAVSKGGAK